MDKSIIESITKNTPLAVIIAGLLLVVTGAAGGWPPALQISGLGWQIVLVVMGAIVAGSGIAFIWREKNLSSNSRSANDSLRLIFFSSEVQTTELRGTKDGLEVYLSDLRPGKDSGIQGDAISLDRLQRILREGDVKVYTDDGTPVLDIGPKKHWLYSKTLFGDPKRLQKEIYALIERTIKFASTS